MNVSGRLLVFLLSLITVVSGQSKAVAVSIQPAPMGQAPEVLVGADLVKPACDKLAYRAIQLPNKLRVLLIHDPDTDKAAAALDVSSGCVMLAAAAPTGQPGCD